VSVKPISYLVFLLTLVAGCSSPEPETSSKDEPQAVAVADDDLNGRLAPPTPVTDREPNTDGKVFIVMYHRIVDEEASDYDRSKENFRKDLETLYEAGFRPVTLGEYVDNTMDIPPGATPVVMTFDDSDPSQIRFLEDGTLDPESGVGIWTQFAEEHPDFPVKGSFFVLRSRTFTGDGRAEVNHLLDIGCEVESHTLSHQNLAKMTDEEVMAELGGAQEFLRSLGVNRPRFLCLPFGVRPKNLDLLKSFDWNGETVTHDAALMVGSGPAPSPGDPERDAHKLARINAYDGDYGLAYWLKKVESGEVRLYVEP